MQHFKRFSITAFTHDIKVARDRNSGKGKFNSAIRIRRPDDYSTSLRLTIHFASEGLHRSPINLIR